MSLEMRLEKAQVRVLVRAYVCQEILDELQHRKDNLMNDILGRVLARDENMRMAVEEYITEIMRELAHDIQDLGRMMKDIK